jgi:hypothetical protein
LCINSHISDALMSLLLTKRHLHYTKAQYTQTAPSENLDSARGKMKS